ncbi:SAM-dependent methyltransferase [Pseudonocardia lacus]|uniref:SAM-dependent methyltransferase n=1 Tax=Pseudonocardia lacus TaxID=2835865 RepID=UPI001BDCA7AD|nr:SAM-dependent methyltransferase [Pseudonocardia lacus]
MTDDWSGAGDPPRVDVTRPSTARVFDYLLGGREHFAADRRAAESVLERFPRAGHLAKDTRDLLRRGVVHLAGTAGVRQFIDLGSGLPSTGNAHEVAHRIDPTARVLYVDHDPMVLSHARTLGTDGKTTMALSADVRDTAAVFDHPVTRGFIDVDRPLAVLASGILHHMHDPAAAATAGTIVERLGPGSYLLLGHFVDDGTSGGPQIEAAIRHMGLGTYRYRTWEELRQLLDGLDVLEPGLVYGNEWHPDELTPTDSPSHTLYAAALGRKPG